MEHAYQPECSFFHARSIRRNFCCYCCCRLSCHPIHFWFHSMAFFSFNFFLTARCGHAQNQEIIFTKFDTEINFPNKDVWRNFEGWTYSVSILSRNVVSFRFKRMGESKWHTASITLIYWYRFACIFCTKIHWNKYSDYFWCCLTKLVHVFTNIFGCVADMVVLLHFNLVCISVVVGEKLQLPRTSDNITLFWIIYYYWWSNETESEEKLKVCGLHTHFQWTNTQ